MIGKIDGDTLRVFASSRREQERFARFEQLATECTAKVSVSEEGYLVIRLEKKAPA